MIIDLINILPVQSFEKLHNQKIEEINTGDYITYTTTTGFSPLRKWYIQNNYINLSICIIMIASKYILIYLVTHYCCLNKRW